MVLFRLRKEWSLVTIYACRHKCLGEFWDMFVGAFSFYLLISLSEQLGSELRTFGIVEKG